MKGGWSLASPAVVAGGSPCCAERLPWKGFIQGKTRGMNSFNRNEVNETGRVSNMHHRSLTHTQRWGRGSPRVAGAPQH